MLNQAPVLTTPLPNGRPPEVVPVAVDDPAAQRARIQELEALCAEVYVAAVELGLPQPLLNRLWTVAAQGSAPQTYGVEMPARPASATPDPMPIPDIRLTDRAHARDESAARAPSPELKPLTVRKRVMVVDDDSMMLEVLVRILQRENYELIAAASGPEAIQKATADEGEIDLLITDYAMPVMKGRELADRMRTRYKDLRVLYQTGFSDMLFEDRVELEEQSAFLEKPFTARGLREAARFILFGAINPE